MIQTGLPVSDPNNSRTLPTIKADRAGRLPAFMLQEFEKHGHTYTQQLPGQYVVLTRSPANVEAVCRTRFKGASVPCLSRTGFFSHVQLRI
jgi:hypothetical protein